jgi:group I intron endonuclease
MRRIISGIYCIVNCINFHCYIGYSKNIYRRLTGHKRNLNKNKHGNPYLQYAWNKYSKDVFEVFIIEECEENDLQAREMYYISEMQSKYPNGYNLNDGGSGGLNPTEETRKKSSESHMGRFTGELNPFYGKHPSDETRKKMSEGRKGKCVGADHPRYGKGLSENARIALLAANKGRIREKGKKMNLSPEQREKIRQMKLGTAYHRFCKPKNSISKYMGVGYRKESGRWRATIHEKNVTYSLGTFETEIEAALAWNQACLELFGSKAILNIIPQSEIDSLWESTPDYTPAESEQLI